MCVCCWKQEGLVLLVDVGPAMHSVLPDVEKTCSLLMQKKVKYDSFFSFHSQIIYYSFFFFVLGRVLTSNKAYCICSVVSVDLQQV